MNEKFSPYDVICRLISAHEHNHRLNGDESTCASSNHVQSRIFGIFEHKIKTQKHISDTKIWKPSITSRPWKVQAIIFGFRECIFRVPFGIHDDDRNFTYDHARHIHAVSICRVPTTWLMLFGVLCKVKHIAYNFTSFIIIYLYPKQASLPMTIYSIDAP